MRTLRQKLAIKTLNRLLQAQSVVQEGCYIERVFQNKQLNAYYVLSKNLPDVGWNFAVLKKVDPNTLGWLIKIAKKQNKKPCVFSWEPLKKDIEESGFRCDEERESWMDLNLNKLSSILKPAEISECRVIFNERPSQDFLNVFSRGFRNKKIQQHFKNYYVPALKGSRVNKKVTTIHLIAHVNKTPVSCASAYMSDGFLGLYNVVTDVNYQNKSFGKWVSCKILEEGRALGAKTAFLQCVSDGHVEKMYSKIGFKKRGTGCMSVIQV